MIEEEERREAKEAAGDPTAPFSDDSDSGNGNVETVSRTKSGGHKRAISASAAQGRSPSDQPKVGGPY